MVRMLQYKYVAMWEWNYNFIPNIAATAAIQYTKYDELKGSKDWDFYSEGPQFQYDGGMSNESNLFSLSLLFTL